MGGGSDMAAGAEGTGAGFDYNALGKALSSGLNQYGSALEQGASHNYMTNTPNMPQSAISAASPQTNVIPGSGMLGASVPYQNSGSMEALMRLLQGMYS